MASDRVQVWMDREQFEKLLALFWGDAGPRLIALAEFEHEQGPFVELLAALEEARGNNANLPVDADAADLAENLAAGSWESVELVRPGEG